jgi:hypothetical protein
MPLPYKDPSSALMTLVDNMAQTGMRVGGTSEMMVGEGRADAPVGTTIAMIDQATKILNAVHKRMHSAQAEEFQLLVRTFKEHPDSFWQRIKKPAYQWSEQVFLQALNDCELVPQADPNTASHSQRMMKIMALKQLQASNPSMYDPIAIDTEAMKAAGWSNPEQFLAPPSAQMRPPPQLLEAQARISIDQKKADAQMMVAEAKVAETQAKIGQGQDGQGGLDPMKLADLKIKAAEIEERSLDAQLDAMNRKRDRESRERLAALKLVEQIAENPQMLQMVQQFIDPAMLQRLEGQEPPLSEENQ